MTIRTTVRALAVPLAAAVLVLGGCGGDESGDGSGDETRDTGAAADPDGSDPSGHGRKKAAGHECVGEHHGKLTLDESADTPLPGGGTAALDGADLDADPPTATLALGESTRIERQNATDLAVGDQFGVQRAVYKVVGICTDRVLLDEF